MTIAAIIKDEQAYLQEWIDYHAGIGVSLFLLANNGTSTYEHIIAPAHADVRILEWSKQRSRQAQVNFYGEVCRTLPSGEYVAFIDVDEFLDVGSDFAQALMAKPEHAGKSLLEAALQELNKDTLALSWQSYNAGGHVKKPQGAVVENFLQVAPKVRDRHNFKTVMRATPAAVWSQTPHRPDTGVDLYDTNGNLVPAVTTDDLYDKLFIRHYITKSWEEYVEKLKRGNFTSGIRKVNTFFEYNPDMLPKKEELTKGLNPSDFPTAQLNHVPHDLLYPLVEQLRKVEHVADAAQLINTFYADHHNEFKSEPLMLDIVSTWEEDLPGWREVVSSTIASLM